MKALFLLFLLAIFPLSASADDSGICGENVYYSYDSTTHTLTIYGEGRMTYLPDEDLYPWYSFHDDIQHIEIEPGVWSIEMFAFWGCSGLTSITLPESLSYINDYAFGGCKSLEAVYISDLEAYLKMVFAHIDYPSNPLYYAHHLFLNGKEIIDLVIPDGITAINNYALVNGSNIKTIYIPNSVTFIGEGAFDGCNSLTSVTIPSSVTRMVGGAFSGNNITSMKVESGNKIYDSRDNCNAIIETASNTLINGCKTSYIPSSVTSIGQHAFKNCSGLTSITIPNSVTSIGLGAFSGCSGLTSVTISNNVTSIDNSTFQNCSDLISVTIPNNVTSIGNDAFNGCSGLSSITIPNSVTSIGTCAFQGCSGLTSITIPNSVTSIGTCAFQGCSGLTSVTIPNSVTNIGNTAFYGCSCMISVISEIENPFEIGNTVFSYIPSDAQLIVPKGTKAKYQATAGWNQFTNIMEAGEEPDLSGQIHINDIYYKVTGSGEVEVVSVEEGEKSVSVPSTISHNNTTYKVTSIAKEVFDNREYLAAVIWEPEAQFNATVNNPNFLLYVKDEKYASHTVKNVVVNGVAERIELADAANGNDFYCPRAFTAKNISYSHNYQMETGLGESKGWETIVLPFDVQKYTHATKGELETFTTWSRSSNRKPFWLFELTTDGYKDAAGIKANTPYIISMPNNKQYEQQYQIPGVVTFSASDVEVQMSDNLKPVSYQGRSFVPNYTNQNNADFLALNVSNNYVTNPGKDISGSKFVRGLRAVHPFEAYMTTTDNTRSIDVMDGMTTAIRGIQMVKDESSTIKVYDTRGVLLKTATSMDDVKKGLKVGVYIVNGKKMIIK